MPIVSSASSTKPPHEEGGAGCTSIRALFARPWELLGLGCFFAWFQVMRQTVMSAVFPRLIDAIDNRVLFEVVLAVALIVFVIVDAMLDERLSVRVALGFGIAGSIAGSLFGAAFALDAPTVLVAACLICSCIAESGLVLLWCRRLASTSSERMTAHMLVSVLFARIFGFVCNLLAISMSFLAVVMLPIACALLFGASSAHALPTYDALDRDSSRLVSRKRAALIAIASILLGVTMGIYKQAYSIAIAPEGSSLALSLTILAIHLLVLVSVLGYARGSRFVATYQATVFLLALGCAIAPVTTAVAPALSPALILWSQFMFLGLFCTIVPRITVSAGGRDLELAGWCFAAFYVSSTIGSLMCEVVCPAIDSTGPSDPINLIVTASVLLLICTLLVHFYLFREHDVQSLVDRREREYRTGQAALRQGCMQVASVYGLSERESDVLSRWATGKTASEIGNELCISQNTVRTHVRHIYEKTLTRDRDGLIDLIRAL